MTARPNPTRLLSVGSIIADISINVPALPQRGGDVIGSPARVSAGGRIQYSGSGLAQWPQHEPLPDSTAPVPMAIVSAPILPPRALPP